MDIQAYIQSGVIESYVLGIANEQEVAELKRLQHEYPDIAAAVAKCEAWLSQTLPSFAEPVAPADKEKIWAALQEPAAVINKGAREIPMQTAGAKRVAMPARYVAAASIVLFLASAAFNIYLYGKYTKANQEYLGLLNERTNLLSDNKIYQTKLSTLKENMQLMTAPEMLKVTMPGIAGKEQSLATVYWNTSNKKVYLMANNLPAAPAGKQYQLWALVDGKPIDAGMLEDCKNLCPLKTIERADAFAITLEKEGGSPIPDLSQLFVMGKVQS